MAEGAQARGKIRQTQGPCWEGRRAGVKAADEEKDVLEVNADSYLWLAYPREDVYAILGTTVKVNADIRMRYSLAGKRRVE